MGQVVDILALEYDPARRHHREFNADDTTCNFHVPDQVWNKKIKVSTANELFCNFFNMHFLL